MIQEWYSPFGEYVCKADFRAFLCPVDKLVVLSYSPGLAFPWRASLRSLFTNNPKLDHFLFFIEEGTPDEDIQSIEHILQDKQVYFVWCQREEAWKQGDHPKSCVYWAPNFVPARAYLFIDLDTIVTTALSYKLDGVKDSCSLRYVPEHVGHLPYDLWAHCFNEEGIYHGTPDDADEIGYDKVLYETETPLINTGVMMGSHYCFSRIATCLMDLHHTEGVRKWVHERIEGVYTRHREQAMFDLAFRVSKLPMIALDHSWNYQLLTKPWPMPTAEFPSVMHFNGYHNPETPSRKLFDSLLATNQKFRQLCGL